MEIVLSLTGWLYLSSNSRATSDDEKSPDANDVSKSVCTLPKNVPSSGA